MKSLALQKHTLRFCILAFTPTKFIPHSSPRHLSFIIVLEGGEPLEVPTPPVLLVGSAGDAAHGAVRCHPPGQGSDPVKQAAPADATTLIGTDPSVSPAEDGPALARCRREEIMDKYQQCKNNINTSEGDDLLLR